MSTSAVDAEATTAARYRAIFLSDIHLGTRACQADKLLDFLRAHDADYIYLVGDIFDLWAMSRGIYWSSRQNTVVQKILKRARHGARICLIPGNHDEALREHLDVTFGNITVLREAEHTGATGLRYLIVHGDEFDQVTRYHRWIAALGDHGYALLVKLNVWLSWWRRTLGVAGHWSLAGFMKQRLKSAQRYIVEFEQALARMAQTRGFDGVVCGHIHAANVKQIEGTWYLNCGDWVDSCTALIEHFDGRMELVSMAGATAPARELAMGNRELPRVA